VGLERYIGTYYGQELVEDKSPSHTVGLEPSENLACGSSYAVSIPHGGFGTKIRSRLERPEYMRGHHPTRWA